VTGVLVAVDVAFLMHRENFSKNLLTTLVFLSGVIAFRSSLIMTMTWLHCLVPLGLNVNVSSFPMMSSLMILAITSIVALAVVKNGLPRINGVRQQTSISSAMKSMGMKEFLILTRISSTIPIGCQIDAHTCSEITESLIKHLGANQTRDGRNTWVAHLIRKTIKDSSTTSLCKHEPVHFGYWSLLVEDILQIPWHKSGLAWRPALECGCTFSRLLP
jgi:hypothetical protein